jgi:hypothetical protein
MEERYSIRFFLALGYLLIIIIITRGFILFLVYYWYLALDVFGWNYFNVNYKVYLGFNYHFSTVTAILRRASILSSIFLVVFILYVMQVEDMSDITTYIMVLF